MNDILISGNHSSSNIMFGGKVVVFGGDFRQILPVVQNGSMHDIVNASLCFSYIWSNVKVLRLTKNMRLSLGNDSTNIKETTAFSNWLLDIGEGKVGEANDGESTIDIPEDLLNGVPNHQLVLKVGVPIMPLRNIDQKNGLCNGTRLRVLYLGNRVIEAEIISGANIGTRTFIPRLSLSLSDKKIPFKFKRRQFPVVVCFAMTINKSQGQSLSKVGLFLQDPVFSHGQLYVALSRVKSRAGLKMPITDKDGHATNKTTNVVYKYFFGNL
ncbi:uncharacterized protein LOC110901899 [Helianthus annuus]|uniref:uncharacterized protein LOC110901899 n=1 Tax=Helianthus annuus TaxID=4232 RepID=UPI001652C861|nr:uncharacterized protein LOC110901899 [Helianthus annuus]